MTEEEVIQLIKKLDFELVNDGRFDETGNGYCRAEWWISVKYNDEEINKIPMDRIIQWIEDIEETIY